MEGFGVHSFRFINANNKSFFVKFHWKPLLGIHSVAWDEAQKISGKDPDFHRRDLWEAIENGAFPEWELGVQLVPEKDEHKFEFDLLDPTKLIPEELVPVKRIGKLTLNRNPDNFFAETEQVAFHPGHLVPGIDFTNDPLLQGRLFSYTDTQLSRLGSPNFHEIPINRPIVPVQNNQRDGHMRQQIDAGKSAHSPNTTAGGCPFQAKASEGGFTSYNERIDAKKIRARSQSFFDHFSQARLFLNSQSVAERNHLTDALRFELGKLISDDIKKRMLGLLSQVDQKLAEDVADELGMQVPKNPEKPMNHSIPADGNPRNFQPIQVESKLKKSEALSMVNTVKDTIKSRQVAILAAQGVDADTLNKTITALQKGGATVQIIATKLGVIKNSAKQDIKVNQSFLTACSVLFDAVYIPAGKTSVEALSQQPDAIHFINEAYRHCKAIGADGEGVDLLKKTAVAKEFSSDKKVDPSTGVVIDRPAKDFVQAIAKHRVWEREAFRKVPA